MRRAVALAITLAACTPRAPDAARPVAEGYEPSGPLPGGTRVAFTLARGAFLDRPFPTELDRHDDGRIDLGDFPGRGGGLLGTYADLVERERDGFSVAETVYFRFEGAIGTLPRDPRSTTAPSSPVLLMDVDAASPDRGSLVAIESRLYDKATAYVPAGTLAVKPLGGLVLRPGTLYAAVVRRSLGDAGGVPLGTTGSLESIKATRPRADATEERARVLFAPALDVLASRGVGRAEIAAIAVFRTGRPHASTQRLVAGLDRLAEAHTPSLIEAALDAPRAGQSYVVVRGSYCTPSFQESVDQAPFLERGGELSRDASGAPRVAPIERTSEAFDDVCDPLLRARFVLSLPREPTGREVPLIVTAHGTGGDAATFLGERDFAGWAAKLGIAVVSTDQPLHGARPGVGKPVYMPLGPLRVPLRLRPEVFFYNPFRPAATLANLAQATADAGLLVRLFSGLDLQSARAKDGRPLVFGSRGATLPRLSSSRVLLAGHSQGSQSLFALGAFDPRVRAVLVSGAGGDLRYGVLENKEFAAVRALLEPLLGLQDGELDPFHPVLALVQILADPADPQTYARFYRELPPGRGPTSVLHLEGLRDGYNPEAAAEALAAALVATPIAPLEKPFAALDVLGLHPAVVVRGNAAGGRATIAFAQIAPTHGEDGHFVMYREPAGAALVTGFFASVLVANDDPPRAGPR